MRASVRFGMVVAHSGIMALMRDQDFERLYAEHAGPLLGFLMYRTGDRPLAEDLLAETFERVLRTRWRFDPRKGREKTWLYTIALNCLRDHLRRQGAERRATERTAAMDPSEGAADLTAGVAQRDELQRALAELSHEERDAIALRYGTDLTIPEIAKLLGEPESTASGRVFRALRKLRENMESRV